MYIHAVNRSLILTCSSIVELTVYSLLKKIILKMFRFHSQNDVPLKIMNGWTPLQEVNMFHFPIRRSATCVDCSGKWVVHFGVCRCSPINIFIVQRRHTTFIIVSVLLNKWRWVWRVGYMVYSRKLEHYDLYKLRFYNVNMQWDCCLCLGKLFQQVF